MSCTESQLKEPLSNWILALFVFLSLSDNLWSIQGHWILWENYTHTHTHTHTERERERERESEHFTEKFEEFGVHLMALEA
jgi:hypothetical protein